MESVLLLNASFEPLKVISWQRATCMFFSGKVEVVEEYEHDIRSVSLAIKAPAVVRLLKFVRIGKRKPPLSRLNVLARDNFECQYCGLRLNARNATLDHIIPKSLNGKSTWQNMVCCCSACNLRKGCHTPREAKMRLKRTPFQPDWLPVIRFKLNGNVPESWFDFLHAFGAKT